MLLFYVYLGSCPRAVSKAQLDKLYKWRSELNENFETSDDVTIYQQTCGYHVPFCPNLKAKCNYNHSYYSGEGVCSEEKNLFAEPVELVDVPNKND